MKLSQDLLFAVGRPFSPFYSWLMRVRSGLYGKGVFRQHKLSVPVISVGNLTMGGTGKTPAVAYIAAHLQSLGYRPAIISRGYGGRAGKAVNLVSDGRKILLDAAQAGDEPAMLAEKLTGVPVLTGRHRLHPCRYAMEQLRCNILILDDGFQHLAVARDINLVLFNATSLAGNSRVFPGGELREPVAALRRCNAFLLTGIDPANRARAERFAELLGRRFPDRPVFYASLDAGPLVEAKEATSHQHGSSSSPLYAFSAIAHPGRFLSTLVAAGIEVAGHTPFPDHHPYRQGDIDDLCRSAAGLGARGLVTTEKDRVKLKTLHIDIPLFIMKTRFRPDEIFPAYLSDNLPPPS